jgi:hypothetical protein
MAFTSVLSDPTDRRSDSLDRRPVWERIITFTIDAGDGSAKTAQAVPLNGIIQKIIATSGTATGITGTFTLSIEDNGDNEIFTASGPAEGATSTWSATEPVTGIIDVYIDPNDDPTSGSWTITITLRGI